MHCDPGSTPPLQHPLSIEQFELYSDVSGTVRLLRPRPTKHQARLDWINRKSEIKNRTSPKKSPVTHYQMPVSLFVDVSGTVRLLRPQPTKRPELEMESKGNQTNAGKPHLTMASHCAIDGEMEPDRAFHSSIHLHLTMGPSHCALVHV